MTNDLNRETQQIWDANARFWDARFGEGNDFQRLLIGPSTERLLALRPGELVLDAACGNGAFSPGGGCPACDTLHNVLGTR